MHVQLVSVFLSQFRSFTHEATFDAPTAPGVYLVRGDNRLDAGIGSNGAGKSSLWDALCWCLYGKTSRGLKGPKIVSWHTCGVGTAFVSVSLLIDGVPHLIKRTQSPNSLSVRIGGAGSPHMECTQADLDGIMGVGYTLFLNSAYVSQMAPLFLDLSDTEKASILSTVLGLDQWVTYSEAARDATKTIQTQVMESEKQLASVDGALKIVQEDIDAVEGEIAQWKKENSTAVAALTAELKTLEETKADYERRMERIDQYVPTFDFLHTVLDNHCESIAESRKHLERELQDLRSSVSRAMVRKEDRILLYDEQKKLVGSTCPTCGSKVADPARPDCSDIEQAVAYLEQKISAVTLQVEGVEQKENRVEALYHMVEQAISSMEAHELAKKHEHTENTILRVRAERNAAQAAYSMMAERKDALVHKQQRLQQEHTRIAASHERLCQWRQSKEYWINGFRSLRLHLAQEGATEFEQEMLSALSNMGISGWGVRCDIDPEKVGHGKSRNGVRIEVMPTGYSGRHATWETLSGGESQYLRLCGTYAISSLIQNRHHTHFGWEVYDEPSRYISDEGLIGLLDMLRARATLLKKVIFLTDHRHLESQPFDGVYEVQKDQLGSSIRQVH